MIHFQAQCYYLIDMNKLCEAHIALQIICAVIVQKMCHSNI